MPVSLTRQVGFHATHRLELPGLSTEENLARFGWTARPHDHHYTCLVTVTGPLRPGEGTVMDLSELDAILLEAIVEPLDDADLNQTLPSVASGEVLPVCETLAAWCFARVADRLPGGVRLERVRVAEDPTLYADCTGLP
jgi:6-pyruvoyl-tetrahydropterin synthase